MMDDPDMALLVAAIGIAGIYVEMCRPGRVVPGVAGGVALLVGIASIVRTGTLPSLVWTVAVLVPLAGITWWLGRVAIRARRNKRVG